ncbi:hypothetical protein V0R50_31085 [Pseudomonas sp. 148P]|uniref:Uncharacterized protein n=1 Tax=Pseudomonas ulcerans TaxID=3115852 RepID=A0ABU7I1I8_9PSED|nr:MULTISPECIES: hypothetical protein [unclassified Pseudomonas]MEE1926465.1 hypothetical protein [Pseudomonas sp. 147P]MEE1937689.1 hypothetical protein [Pseudomonas sp. 148P]
MDSSWFNEGIKPSLKGCSLEYSSFPNGDFGDLERIELEGFSKLGTVEFWSKGWIGIDIYDCALECQVMNVLLSPEEKDSVHQAFERFIEILTQDS